MNNTKVNINTMKSHPFIEIFGLLNPKTLRILAALKLLTDVLAQVISLDTFDMRNQIILIKEFSEKVSDNANSCLTQLNPLSIKSV